MIDTSKLKSCLDKLSDKYGTHFLESDPVGIVHEYETSEDREVAGFVVSVLAYGKASLIRKSAHDVLKHAGKSPAKFVRSLTPEKSLEAFSSFRHRWTDGSDIAFIFWVLGEILNEYETIGELIKTLDDPREPTTKGVMTRFSEWVTGKYSVRFRRNASRTSISFLVPSPAGGSACKRNAMYFRWMVRGPDSVDFGIWRFISPDRLVIPVDRHIARMARLLGLTSRRSPDWKMALEITESLRCIYPIDPVRYDFALVRLGILGECTPSAHGDCQSCVLHDVCLEAV